MSGLKVSKSQGLVLLLAMLGAAPSLAAQQPAGRGISLEDVAEATTETAEKFFRFDR